MQITKCNMCGKEIKFEDKHGGISFRMRRGYPSEFDGCALEIDFCVECADKEMERLIRSCVISPL